MASKKQISILRGINVGGNKLIKMQDLRDLYESLGFESVVSYIQSGNVIFDANKGSADDHKQSIQKAIKKRYGFDVPVIIRNHSEIKRIVKVNPFGPVDLATNGKAIGLSFLSAKPNKVAIADLGQYVKEPEQLQVIGKEVFLYLPNGYGKTKLTNNLLEKKLNVEATTRNWKTVCKLLELSAN